VADVSRFWLGPFAVVKERRAYHGVRQWMIVTVTGQSHRAHIPYMVDAQAQCDVMNAAGGVASKVVPRTPRYRWSAAAARKAGRRGGDSHGRNDDDQKARKCFLVCDGRSGLGD